MAKQLLLLLRVRFIVISNDQTFWSRVFTNYTESLGWIAARDLNELFGKNITKLQIPAF